MSHPIIHPNMKHAASRPPSWPSYTGASHFVGTSRSGVSVWVDPTTGTPGMQNATDLLADADRIVAANTGFFGTVSQPVNVILFALGGATDGTGGADHMACDFVNGGNIEVCVSFGASMRCSALFEAELSECSMGNSLCGLSTGEALSRWCAADVSNNAMADFSTAPIWQKDGMQNFVDTIDPTDQNADSIGCGMAFLSWLMKLGNNLSTIARAMVTLGDNGTLADLYASLTGKPATDAWQKFGTDVLQLGAITSDDPFGAGMPAPSPTPVPTPKPPPPVPPSPPAPTGMFNIQGTVSLTPIASAGWNVVKH